jgi:hypothetical protein
MNDGTAGGDGRCESAQTLKPIDRLTGAFINDFSSGKGAFYRHVVKNTALEGRFPEPSRCYGGGADTVVPS